MASFIATPDDHHQSVFESKHHTVSENASTTEPADLLAVFLVDTRDGPLTTDDAAQK
jgi:hypothetical protein